jgi:hypothetical protein
MRLELKKCLHRAETWYLKVAQKQKPPPVALEAVFEIL